MLAAGCAMPGSNTAIKPSAPSSPQQPPATTPSQQPQPQNQTAQSPPPAAQQPANLTPASMLPSENITYVSDAWEIHGTLYDSAQSSPTKLIVLVPGLGTTRDSYPQDFIASLHDSIPDALILAIDPKGHGESTNLGSWRDFDTAQMKDMRYDVIDAKPPIVKMYPTVKQLFVVGASMGSTSAIMAAAKEKSITKVVMLSPGLDYNQVDITGDDGLDSYAMPILAVASSGDAYAAQSAAQIQSMTSDVQTTVKIYDGTAHGTDLFAATAGTAAPVSGLIIDFLKN